MTTSILYIKRKKNYSVVGPPRCLFFLPNREGRGEEIRRNSNRPMCLKILGSHKKQHDYINLPKWHEKGLTDFQNPQTNFWRIVKLKPPAEHIQPRRKRQSEILSYHTLVRNGFTFLLCRLTCWFSPALQRRVCFSVDFRFVNVLIIIVEAAACALEEALTGRRQASTKVKAPVAITSMYTLSIARVIAWTTKRRVASERPSKAALLVPAMAARMSEDGRSESIGETYATPLVWKTAPATPRPNTIPKDCPFGESAWYVHKSSIGCLPYQHSWN